MCDGPYPPGLVEHVSKKTDTTRFRMITFCNQAYWQGGHGELQLRTVDDLTMSRTQNEARLTFRADAHTDARDSLLGGSTPDRRIHRYTMSKQYVPSGRETECVFSSIQRRWSRRWQ